ncbi:MAG: sarcosine oxidase subunit alpha family protein [Gammaproteobacteria bacterium]|nr:sarcosine oxidase subunit alpha family protein [Gammaproteobacteria bacterium]
MSAKCAHAADGAGAPAKVPVQPARLAKGGLIDRDAPLEFTFNGRRYHGYAGDTLASALLANRVRVVGRSFKYHRPRGVLSAGVEEPNALLEVDAGYGSEALVRATMQPLTQGLTARHTNSWPSLGWDLGRIVDFTRPLWRAGFYNKTFMWPGWHWYEGAIRRVAGIGRLPAAPDRRSYYHQNLHCDVLVAGSGPAGLAAALAAASSGAHVVLVEQDREPGGTLLFEAGRIDGETADAWRLQTLHRLRQMPNVRLMPSATVTGYYDHNVLTVHDRVDITHPQRAVERFWKIRAKEVVLATGAIEQPLVFAGNDRPGIMLASAVRHYIVRYSVTPGCRVAVAANHDEAWRTAFVLQDHDIDVPLIADVRSEPGEAVLAEARRRGLEVRLAAAITNTYGTKGLRSIEVGTLAEFVDGTRRDTSSVRCDALAMSGGWSPAVHLYSQAGGRLRYDSTHGCFVPDRCRQRVRVAGAANGSFGLGAALREGHAVGAAAAEAAGFATTARQYGHAAEADDYPVSPLRAHRFSSADRQWIDFAHDVTVADIEQAVCENYVSVEHLKRYTTTGMSVDQGKTSNLNALAMLAQLTARTIPQVGTTTFRPNYTPVTLGAIAGARSGELYAPARRMPGHAWHAARDAVFDSYGDWLRPAFYAKVGESREQAIRREVLSQREAAGLFEGSPLGKIEVVGPDAAEFLNRIYVNNVLTLKTAQVRYGLMLNENGVVLDDGVFTKLADGHYLLNTTGANADRIVAWLCEWHQCEWPQLELLISPVTEQWAALTVAGPAAREVLAGIETDIDFSAEAFPHMSLRCGLIEGLPARVQRVSFTGERSFEISVPADAAETLCQRIERAGAPYGLVPVGVEAVLVMRLEKGYLHVGSDTDGTTNPFDVGFGAIVDRKQTDFVGSRSLRRPNDQRVDRRQLVGLELLGGSAPLRAGAQLVESRGTGYRSVGFVTSACVSPTLERTVALGMLEGGLARKGDVVTGMDEGRQYRLRVVSPCVYDPAGERING